MEMNGSIVEALRSGNFKVKTENGMIVLCRPCGRMQQNSIRLLMGDSVRIEVSAYDLTRGRITYREKR